MTGGGPFGVLGAGGQAREVAEFAGRSVAFFAVDDGYLAASPARIGDVPVVAVSAALSGEDVVPVVAAIGAPAGRRGMVSRWSGSRFTRAVSSTAYVAGGVPLGVGAMIAPGAVIMTGVVVGDHVLVNAGTTIGHDTVVAEFATLSPGVRVAGGCRIEPGAFLGIGSVVLGGVRIGTGAVIGAGAVVREDVAPFTVNVGVPSRSVRTREDWLDAV